jgi:hypothetical protein
MDETTFKLADVERLAAILDAKCVDLDDKDRTLLHGIFALAGQASAGEPEEVSGFGLLPFEPTTSLFGSFQLGGTTGGPGPIIITKQIGVASPQLLDAHWKSETFLPGAP